MTVVRGQDGRFLKGQSASPQTQFQKGTHWRERKPYWDKSWLEHEYLTMSRSANDIAKQFNCQEANILYWLKKHAIPARSMTEIRKLKRWGATGAANPMYGKRGILAPNWKGGLTPFRQHIYASSEWKQFRIKIRQRDKVCRLCGFVGSLELHHIEPISKAPLLIMDPSNVIFLCESCHKKMLGKERRWRKRLYALIGQTA